MSEKQIHSINIYVDREHYLQSRYSVDDITAFDTRKANVEVSDLRMFKDVEYTKPENLALKVADLLGINVRDVSFH